MTYVEFLEGVVGPLLQIEPIFIIHGILTLTVICITAFIFMGQISEWIAERAGKDGKGTVTLIFIMIALTGGIGGLSSFMILVLLFKIAGVISIHSAIITVMVIGVIGFTIARMTHETNLVRMRNELTDD